MPVTYYTPETAPWSDAGHGPVAAAWATHSTSARTAAAHMPPRCYSNAALLKLAPRAEANPSEQEIPAVARQPRLRRRVPFWRWPDRPAVSPGFLAVVERGGYYSISPGKARRSPVRLSSIAWFFDEAKRLADISADGDVATLIDRGINALEENDLDGRRYGPAAQRAGYWAHGFSPGDWKLVSECAKRLQARPGAAEAVVREADRHRIPDMNTDIYNLSSVLGGDDGLALPESGAAPDRMRVWVLRILPYIQHVVEQMLKNYLGMLIAADCDDPVATYQKTQGYVLGEFAQDNGTPDEVKVLLRRVRPLRNAAAHIANVTIADGQILIRPRNGADHEPWQPEEVEDAFKSLLRTLGAVSLGVTIGAGPHYQASAAEEISEAVAAGSDLSLIEHLLTIWMEWSDVRASFHDGTITVEARSAGPVRFGTLVMASGQCNICEAAETLICRVTPVGDGAVWSPMAIEMRVPPSRSDAQPQDDSAAEERIMSEMVESGKIDDAQFFDEPNSYGGMQRLCSDQRFWEGQDGFGLARWSSDLPEGQDSFIQKPSDLWVPEAHYF